MQLLEAADELFEAEATSETFADRLQRMASRVNALLASSQRMRRPMSAESTQPLCQLATIFWVRTPCT